MDKKRYLVYAVVAAILAALIYLQFRTWKNFDWATFWTQARQVSPLHILNAVGLIYFSYFLRAVRWKIFLRPVRKETSTLGLIPPTIIGFTGLALLGRPGELIRPYLIARRTDLSFSSQMAVWAVERIFDIGAFTVLLVLAIFLPGTALRFCRTPRSIRGCRCSACFSLSLWSRASRWVRCWSRSSEKPCRSGWKRALLIWRRTWDIASRSACASSTAGSTPFTVRWLFSRSPAFRC